MVNYLDAAKLDSIFNALASPTRREIVKRVAEKDSTILEIAKPFRMSLPAVSKHVKVLEDADIITKTKKGRSYHLTINPEPLKEASRYLTFYQKFWNERFDSLEKYLEKKKHELIESKEVNKNE